MKIETILRYLRPKYLVQNRKGFCAVCEKTSLFLLVDTLETIRNHAICIRCGSCSRHRHVALWIRRELRYKGILALSDFRSRPELKVLCASATGSIAKALGKSDNIYLSEYFDGIERGGFKDGILNQDLQNLTFPDSMFDLVVTEDVFEHVPDYRKGFAEVHRVLKKGGIHVFTIPYYFDRKTRDLFKIENGERILLEPIEYHGDPIRGQIPCFTHFGYDTLQTLEDLGYETRIEWAWYPDQMRFGAFDCYTFIAKKL